MVSASCLLTETYSSRSAPAPVGAGTHHEPNAADEVWSAKRLSRPLGQRYRLIRELARGNMGSVWLAEGLGQSVQVAIKRVHFRDEGGTLPSLDPMLARAQLLVEAHVTSRLDNPHIVRVLEYGFDADEAYIVMELLQGESLAALLHRQGRLAPLAAAELLAQVAEGLQHVHGAAVVHRDLKPENIFIVDEAGTQVVKLVDFGVATPVSALDTPAESAQEDSLIVGTPQYMSPEQARGCAALDHRSDVWSFGVVAFECLLGFPPFAAKNLVDLIVAICTGPLPVPSALGSVPAGFDAWFRTACARAPQQRFASASEAAAALQLACTTPPAAGCGAMARTLKRWLGLSARTAHPGVGPS